MELRVTLQKRFRSFLLDVDFTIEGDKIGIFGPSGGGKSTLVGLLAGLSRPDKGSIVLDGRTLFDSTSKVNVRTEDRHMGMVFQRPSLFPHLDVKGNLLYGFKRRLPEQRKIAFDDVVEVLKVGHLLDRGVKHLSGGEKQRVAIGRAVLGNPRLLLLDEPMSALDDHLKFQIVPFLKTACSTFGIPYLFISHSLLEMRVMTDRILHIVGGRVLEETTAEILQRGHIGEDKTGYVNLLQLPAGQACDGMYEYTWGNQRLLISSASDQPEALFELSARDIVLIKGRPEAISSRNLLRCSVMDIFAVGNRVGIRLDCGGSHLVAEVGSDTADKLDLQKGGEIYAAIKATAFRKLA